MILFLSSYIKAPETFPFQIALILVLRRKQCQRLYIVVEKATHICIMAINYKNNA
jgi:hypothetical protein